MPRSFKFLTPKILHQKSSKDFRFLWESDGFLLYLFRIDLLWCSKEHFECKGPKILNRTQSFLLHSTFCLVYNRCCCEESTSHASEVLHCHIEDGIDILLLGLLCGITSTNFSLYKLLGYYSQLFGISSSDDIILACIS